MIIFYKYFFIYFYDKKHPFVIFLKIIFKEKFNKIIFLFQQIYK